MNRTKELAQLNIKLQEAENLYKQEPTPEHKRLIESIEWDRQVIIYGGIDVFDEIEDD